MNYYKKKIEKLEAEKSKLYKDIVTLVNEPDSQEASSLRLIYKMLIDQERALWFGDTTHILATTTWEK